MNKRNRAGFVLLVFLVLFFYPFLSVGQQPNDLTVDVTPNNKSEYNLTVNINFGLPPYKLAIFSEGINPVLINSPNNIVSHKVSVLPSSIAVYSSDGQFTNYIIEQKAR